MEEFDLSYPLGDTSTIINGTSVGDNAGDGDATNNISNSVYTIPHQQDVQLQTDSESMATKQKFYQNINFIVFLMSVFNIGQCMVATGQLMVIIPLLEKIFGFQSYQMSFPNICYNVSFGVCSLLIGSRKVKRKVLAIGVGGVIVALGCFLFITPHFISSYKHTTVNSSDASGVSNYGMDKYQMCSAKGADASGEGAATSGDSPPPDGDSRLFNWDYNRADLCLVIFCAAFSIMGIGSSPLHTYIITYLNEISSSGQAGMYLAVFYISGAIGPALGFILGKPFLSIHVTWPAKLKNIEITPLSENWIGAWWMGFLLGGVVILCISVLIVFVGLKNTPPPPTSSSSEGSRQKSPTATYCSPPRNQDPLQNDEQLTATDTTPPVVDVVKTKRQNLILKQGSSFVSKISSVSTNFHIMLIFLGLSFDMLPLTAFTSFLTKIIVLQFRVTANASLITGAVVIPAACIGFALGSVYNKVVPKDFHKILGLCIISFSTIFFVGGMFFSCPTRHVKGVSLDSKKIVDRINYVDCNRDCDCDHYRYEPVCHNKNTYFNPCVIGCRDSAVSQSTVNFLNCKCVEPSNKQGAPTPVTDGGCVDNSCRHIYLYLGAVAITLILVLLLGIPFVLYTLSITKDHLKDFSIGYLQTMVRFFVICGPLLYGYLIDESCILWMANKHQDKKGNCAEYDNKKLNDVVGIAIIITKFMASMCYTWSLILYVKKQHRT